MRDYQTLHLDTD